MKYETRVSWTGRDYDKFGEEFAQTKHNLHENPLFKKEAIIELIDSYPRGQLQAFTMGNNPACYGELTPVDTEGMNGEAILRAVEVGKLWFKLQRIDLAPEYGDVIDSLYFELGRTCPQFRPHKWSAVMLFGSTKSQVYFHVDPKPNMLWHIWGKKRFWLYPSQERIGFKLIQQDVLEDIYASLRDEETDYEEYFEEYARKFDLEPGDVLSWPQNSPHRVEVLDGISLSISSFHETDESIRRGHVYGMNKFLRSRLGLKDLSVREKGAIPWLKSFGFRVLGKAGLLEQASRRQYQTEFKIDPLSQSGVSKISGGPQLTEFAKARDL